MAGLEIKKGETSGEVSRVATIRTWYQAYKFIDWQELSSVCMCTEFWILQVKMKAGIWPFHCLPEYLQALALYQVCHGNRGHGQSTEHSERKVSVEVLAELRAIPNNPVLLVSRTLESL